VPSPWLRANSHGSALWSGDIPATFASLRAQIRAGLNVAVSGIPWWTTDIGGFHGGDPDDPEYRELIVRWFQYGAFCPLFRLHGNREPVMPFGLSQTGDPNEPWSYGEQAYEHIKEALFLRERLRPYIMTPRTPRTPTACRRCGRCSSTSRTTRGRGRSRRSVAPDHGGEDK
jgi:alpha-D-xyloside xylohydrolase